MKGALLLLFAMAVITTSENARAAEEFFAGKTIKLLAATSPGSGTDAYSRAIQMSYARHIPGNPTIIVQYLPSGGGMAATNRIYNLAAKDGTEIGVFNRNTIVRRLLGEDSAKFEPEQFNWLGTPGSYGNNAWVFMIRASLPYNTIEDLKSASEPLNVAGVGSNPFEPIVRDMLGVKMKYIIGYTGARAMLAVESGEADAFGTGFDSVAMIKPDWLTDKKIKFIVQFGHRERLKALPDVPAGRELIKNEDDLALVDLVETVLKTGWPVAAPPGLPNERVAVLRDSFRALMADTEFQATLERSKLDWSPVYGDELQQTMVRMTKTPKAVLERYQELLEKR